jgi:Transglutaminase-like superfamily
MIAPAPTATVPRAAGRLRLAAKLWLAAEIVAAYAQVRWSLKRRTLVGTVERARRFTPDTAGSASVTLPTAYRLARAVGRTLEPLPADSRCLMRSLVLTRLLSRRGIISKLVIGTRSGPEFAAHAWVEVEGLPVLPDGSGEYGRILEM